MLLSKDSKKMLSNRSFENSLYMFFVTRKYKFPSMASDSDDDEVTIEDMDNKMASIRAMFPVKSESELKKALMEASGEVEKAIDILMCPPKGKGMCVH